MRRRTLPVACALLVSIRTRHCCRVMRKRFWLDSDLPGVSIRTQHCCRVMPQFAVRSSAPLCFNPHPALLPGDAGPPFIGPTPGTSFNPHPALLPGDADLLCRCRGLHTVSIRTRHCCRVMRTTRCFSQQSTQCFNPHPALLPGDATIQGVVPRATSCFNPHPALLPGDALRTGAERHEAEVSIRTRHCCRVMPAPPNLARTTAQFQSAPGIAAG